MDDLDFYSDLFLKEDPTYKVSIAGKDDELYFIHPLTGQYMETIEQTRQGWLPAESEKPYWDLLYKRIKKHLYDNNDLYQIGYDSYGKIAVTDKGFEIDFSTTK